MNRSKLIVAGVVIAIAGALGFRVWWYWPEDLPGGRYLEKIEKRGHDYSLHLKPDTSLSDIASLDVFVGYRPSNHSVFQEKMETRPSRFVNDGDQHHYVEYMGEHGRMQFHSSVDEEGISCWLEFLPTDLAIDTFLSKDIAISLELTEPEFKVYIPAKRDDTYMTVTVKNRKIERIFWSRF